MESDPIAQGLRDRQVSRNPLVFGPSSNICIVMQTYEMIMGIFENLLATGEHFILGGKRPTLADFGLFGQLFQIGVIDTTTSLKMREEQPGRMCFVRVYSSIMFKCLICIGCFVWVCRMDDLSGYEPGDWPSVCGGIIEFTFQIINAKQQSNDRLIRSHSQLWNY